MTMSRVWILALALTGLGTPSAQAGVRRPAPVLVVADPASREGVETAGLFPDVEVVDPMRLKDLEATWVQRRLLFIGTSALSQTKALPELEAAASRIPVVIVCSPLLMRMSAYADRESDGKFRVLGDLNHAMNAGMSIQQLDIVPNQNFGFQGDHFRLRAALTSASGHPVFVTTSGACRRAMEVNIYESDKLSPEQEVVDAGYPMAIACDRKHDQIGGRLVMVGFELADIEADSIVMERLQIFLHDLGMAK